MQRGALYLAVYDVSADRERTRLASLLEGYGVRIQKSAFEVRLDRAARARLLAALAGLRLETGWLALYRLSETARRLTVGVLPEAPLDEARHAYVL